MNTHIFARNWLLFYAFMVALAIVIILTAAVGGGIYKTAINQQRRLYPETMPVFSLRLQLAFIAYMGITILLVGWIANGHIVQYYAQFDDTGIHWSAPFGKANIPWHDVQEVQVVEAITGDKDKRIFILHTSQGNVLFGAQVFVDFDGVVKTLQEEVAHARNQYPPGPM